MRHTPLAPLVWKAEAGAALEAISLHPESTKQEILGFGGALTDATCYILGQQTANERQAILHDFFAPGEMALNVCRTCIGASDYSRNAYSYDDSDTQDTELNKFSIDHDKAYILPVLRDARKVNPELFLFSSPWSPPGWMKSSGTMLGGAMRKHSYEPYAQYFRRFLEAYKAEGVAIDAVTVQNEVDADQDGRMPACLWGQEYEIEFVKDHLGPALRKAGLPTKIWVLDHNYALWGRAVDELSDPDLREYVDGIAWHGYAGEPAAMSRVHDAFRPRTPIGPKEDRTLPPLTTRSTSRGGQRHSSGCCRTGRGRLRHGTWCWTRRAIPILAHSLAAGQSRWKTARCRMRPTR